MAATTHKHVTSAVDLFSKSYEIVQKNLKLFLLLASVSIASEVIATIQRISDHKAMHFGWQGIASNSLFGPDFNYASLAGLGILVAIFSVVGLVFGLMQIILTLRSAQGKKPDFDGVWQEFKKKWFKLFLLVICLAIAIVIGFILLIVPGVILIWRLSMAPYVMVDQETDISESIMRSWEMTRGYAWPIYSILLFSVVLGLSTIVPLVGGLISLALAIAYSVAMPLRYVEIRHHLKP